MGGEAEAAGACDENAAAGRTERQQQQKGGGGGASAEQQPTKQFRSKLEDRPLEALNNK